MERITKQKGTIDMYGKQGKEFIYLQKIIFELMEKYNYEYIKVPMFEASELYHRGVGDTTDIVTKETYDFIDRGNRPITLRPEGTAGVVRSYIENKLNNEPIQPIKQYYIGSNFRYERPQSGRLREHTQFGVEVIGSSSVLVDAEIISIVVNFFNMLGLKGIKVKINSLGDLESRLKYKDVLIKYFEKYQDELCEDCKIRLNKNPLRVLDCKVDADKDFMKNAPRTIDYLNETSLNRFQELQSILDELEIDYIIDTNLVRGLDYYSHTVFEIQADIEGFGSQNTLCGGGRYDSLVESLGGPSTPGIGFGLGLERLLLALEKEGIDLTKNSAIDLFIGNLCTDKKIPLILANDIRLSGYNCEIDYMDKSLKGQFKTIERLNPRYFTIIGDDEIKSEKIKIKDNLTKEEEEISIHDIIDFLDSK